VIVTALIARKFVGLFTVSFGSLTAGGIIALIIGSLILFKGGTLFRINPKERHIYVPKEGIAQEDGSTKEAFFLSAEKPQ